MNIKWTDEQIAQLEVLVKKGKSSYQIAEALGMTRSSVIGRCRRSGLKLARTTTPSYDKRLSETRDAMAGKRAAGLSRMAYRVRDDEWMARVAEIPPDTRDVTARLMGDPLPGRSALARRAASNP